MLTASLRSLSTIVKYSGGLSRRAGSEISKPSSTQSDEQDSERNYVVIANKNFGGLRFIQGHSYWIEEEEFGGIPSGWASITDLETGRVINEGASLETIEKYVTRSPVVTVKAVDITEKQINSSENS